MTKRATYVSVLILSLTAVALLSLVGCPSKPATAPPDDIRPEELIRNTAPTASANKITAYVNVSSGCQIPTVNALNKASEQYAGKLEIEIVDFGDGGEGATRWKDSGLECMAIVFGADTGVAWDHQGQRKAAEFLMPPGFNWTIEDLEQALAAAADGQLQKATEEELAGRAAPEPVALEAKAEGDEKTASVMVAGMPTVEITAGAGDLTPIKRAEAAAKALNEWSSEPYKPAQVRTSKTPDGTTVSVKDQTVLAVTQADADAAGVSIEKLAEQWHAAIRSAVVNANVAGDEPQSD